tara:strand:+ start:244 stop:549 length:306 start_codon:yes stop_codon:yes gene_type:complete
MEKEIKKENYYKEVLPKLVDKFKVAIEQCLQIVGQPIDDDINDDKLYNVLKSKRQASEDAKYYAQQIDILQSEINGEDTKEETEEETTITTKSWAKRKART